MSAAAPTLERAPILETLPLASLGGRREPSEQRGSPHSSLLPQEPADRQGLGIMGTVNLTLEPPQWQGPGPHPYML